MSVNSKMSLVGAGSTVTVVDFDLQDEFQDLVFGDSVKTREHVTGMNTGSEFSVVSNGSSLNSCLIVSIFS